MSFEPTESGTRVTERIGIEAPRPLLSVTVGKAVEAHTEMLAGIRRHFEGQLGATLGRGYVGQ